MKIRFSLFKKILLVPFLFVMFRVVSLQEQILKLENPLVLLLEWLNYFNAFLDGFTLGYPLIPLFMVAL